MSETETIPKMKRDKPKLVCPNCKTVADSKVTDSRVESVQNAICRRRQCIVCKHRFKTHEHIDSDGQFVSAAEFLALSSKAAAFDAITIGMAAIASSANKSKEQA